jgi:hypothetical protein
MAEIIRTDGSVENLSPPTGDGYTLEEVKSALGFADRCLLQEVRLGRRHALLIDEEGKLTGRAFNRSATMLALGFQALMPGDYIVGNALLVVCDNAEWR